MKLDLLHLLIILFIALVVYDFFMMGRPKKKVRFNLQPTYFGVPGKRPPNLPVRWGYRNY